MIDFDFGGIDRYIVARGMPMASIGVSRRFMHQNSSAFNPRKYLKEVTEICVACYEVCRTGRDASRVRSLDLEAMVNRYDSGELDPRVV